MNLDPRACISNPGRLVVGPTSFAFAAPSSSCSLGQQLPAGCTAGVHLVDYTFVDGQGNESPLNASPQSINVLANRSVFVASLGNNVPAGVVSQRIYMTLAGGSVYYLAATIGALVTSTVISLSDAVLATKTTPPTSSPGPWPYFGGAALGFVRAAKLIRTQTIVGLNSEARGRDGVSFYGGKFGATFVFVLMQNDPDANAKTWATATGPNYGTPVSSLPAPGRSVQPGLIAPDSPLLFVADNPAQPSCLILAPAWNNGARLEIAEALNLPYEQLIVVGVGDDANQHDVRVGLVQDLSLT